MHKTCKKCEAAIPDRLLIAGKWKTFQNRKYCLSCSPFGSHNTRALEGTHLKVKTPCRVCGNQHHVRKGTLCPSCFTKLRRYKHKIRAVRLLGSRCCRCGYVSEHPAPFQFHHREPSEKSFVIGYVSQHKWERVLAEVEKCDLLCANCHALEHATPLDSPLWEELKRMGELS